MCWYHENTYVKGYFILLFQTKSSISWDLIKQSSIFNGLDDFVNIEVCFIIYYINICSLICIHVVLL